MYIYLCYKILYNAVACGWYKKKPRTVKSSANIGVAVAVVFTRPVPAEG